MRRPSRREATVGTLASIVAVGALGYLMAKPNTEVSGHPLAGATPVAESPTPTEELPQMEYEAPVLAQNVKAVYDLAPKTELIQGRPSEGITRWGELPLDNGITAIVSERSVIMDDFTHVNRIEVGQEDPSGINGFTITLTKSPDGVWGATCEDGQNSLEVNGDYVTLDGEIKNNPHDQDGKVAAQMTLGQITKKASEFTGILQVPGNTQPMEIPPSGLCASLVAK